jgi:hypothetical protein
MLEAIFRGARMTLKMIYIKEMLMMKILADGGI